MSIIEIALGFALGVVFVVVLSHPGNPFARDDCDGPDGRKCGLAIYIDHKTGVQYVGTFMGGLAVRVDADGKPMRAAE